VSDSSVSIDLQYNVTGADELKALNDELERHARATASTSVTATTMNIQGGGQGGTSPDFEKLIRALGGLEQQLKGTNLAPRESGLLPPLSGRRERDERENNVLLREMNRSIRGIGGSIGGMGKSGDALGAGIDIGEKLLDAWDKLPGPAKLATVGVGSVLAIGYAVNKMTEPYESSMQEAMKLAAALGDLSSSVTANSAQFAVAMKTASDSAAEYGYTFKEGQATMFGLGRAGANIGASGSDARAWFLEDVGDVFRYSRGYGIDPNEATPFLGLNRRYFDREGGNVLGMVAGGLGASGMSDMRFSEYMQAMTSIFQSGLENGVTQGFDKIASTQNWLSQLGEPYKGERGARIINALTSGFSSAQDLNSEQDIIAYQAAEKMTAKKFADAGKTGQYDMMDVRATMEQPMTADMFRSYFQTLEGYMGDNPTEMKLTMQRRFGLSSNDAIKMYDLAKTGNWNKAFAPIASLVPNVAGTPEGKFLKNQEEIKEAIRDIGRTLLPLKQSVMNTTGGVLKTLGNFMGGSYEDLMRKALQGELNDVLKPIQGAASPTSGNAPPQMLSLLESYGDEFELVASSYNRYVQKYGGQANDVEKGRLLGVAAEFKNLVKDDPTTLQALMSSVKDTNSPIYKTLSSSVTSGPDLLKALEDLILPTGAYRKDALALQNTKKAQALWEQLAPKPKGGGQWYMEEWEGAFQVRQPKFGGGYYDAPLSWGTGKGRDGEGAMSAAVALKEFSRIDPKETGYIHQFIQWMATSPKAPKDIDPLKPGYQLSTNDATKLATLLSTALAEALKNTKFNFTTFLEGFGK
jgi:hypothetical protein